MKPGHTMLLSFAVLFASIAAVVMVRGSARSAAEASTSLPVSSSSQAAMPAIVDDHRAQMNAALHDLESGATCDVRMRAIDRLTELNDPNAVDALRAARTRRDNACLRAAAARAIKALDGRI